MATFYITEYQFAAVDALNRIIPCPMELPLAEQTIPIGGSSVASAALQPNTQFVRLHCDIPCNVAVGKNPTASATNRRMGTDATEFIGVQPNQSLKYAVIAN